MVIKKVSSVKEVSDHLAYLKKINNVESNKFIGRSIDWLQKIITSSEARHYFDIFYLSGTKPNDNIKPNLPKLTSFFANMKK